MTHSIQSYNRAIITKCVPQDVKCVPVRKGGCGYYDQISLGVDGFKWIKRIIFALEPLRIWYEAFPKLTVNGAFLSQRISQDHSERKML